MIENVEYFTSVEAVREIAKDIRREMESIHGEDLAVNCIEASEKIVEALSERLGIEAITVEGWCRYDDECYGSDRPWDPHTWVEVSGLGLYVDVTADQFNYGMAFENEFSEVIVQKGLPYGMQYEEPTWKDYEEIFAEIDEAKITESARISVTWDSYGIAVDFNYSYDQAAGYIESVLCFAETYDEGSPDEYVWEEALELAQFLEKKFSLPLDVLKDETFLENLDREGPSLLDEIASAFARSNQPSSELGGDSKNLVLER